MSKILFVEDELSSNIPALLTLFDSYLKHPERKSLKQIENDDSGYGASNEEIKAIFKEKENPCIDVEYSFPGALKAISERCDDYLLFIVDRNLSKAPSDLADIQTIIPAFSEAQYNQYKEREGDFLLEFLISKNINCCNSFYFMTANGPEDALRNEETIAKRIMFNEFKKSNFIEKGNNGEDFVRFRDEIVNDLDTLKLVNKYSDVFKVFEHRWLDNQYRKELVAVINDMDNWQKPNNIKDNAGRIRRIFESIYGALAKKTSLLIKKEYYNEVEKRDITLIDGRDNLKIREIIKYFETKTELSPAQADTARFIWSMTSEIIHEGVNKTLATQYTNRALVYGLCDAILWFKSKMEEHEMKEKKLYRS